VQELIGLLGRVAGYAGILACVFAVALRLLGHYTIASVSAAAILQGGIALVAIGCFLSLQRMEQ
jgi:hypothetical protein